MNIGLGARVRAAMVAFVTLGLVLPLPMSAQAAGAFAVGKCAAYGYAFDFVDAGKAAAQAHAKCGAACKLLTMRKACAAFAVDMKNPCGAHGYAVDKRISSAQNTALKFCYQYGGKECVIRAWACDAKG